MTDNVNQVELPPTYVSLSFVWTPSVSYTPSGWTPSVTFNPSANYNTALTFTATATITNQGNDLQGPLTLVEYYWDFGDGTNAYGNPVTHTYSQPFFNATTVLKVTDSKGRQWFTRGQLYLH